VNAQGDEGESKVRGTYGGNKSGHTINVERAKRQTIHSPTPLQIKKKPEKAEI